MQSIVLSNLPVSLPLQELATRLRIRDGSPSMSRLEQLVREAEAIARPKALCGVAYIEERAEDHVVVDGVQFSSRVLAVNLSPVNRVFPYLATCGTELDEWAKGFDDLLDRYWVEAIQQAAMRIAFTAVERHLESAYGVSETSRMGPGSLEDWPIQEQVALFRLLGDTEGQVGVRLTESCLMLPTKSVSGIRFMANGTWENCMLCPRPACPSRRAAYDPSLLSSRFGQPAP
jgi:hypothetical protein